MIWCIVVTAMADSLYKYLKKLQIGQYKNEHLGQVTKTITTHTLTEKDPVFFKWGGGNILSYEF